MRDFLLGKNKNKSANKKKIVGEKGFTLIEVLISISIFSIIIGTVILFSVRTIEAHTKSQAMQNAIVPIVFNGGGQKEIVNNECGFKVKNT